MTQEVRLTQHDNRRGIMYDIIIIGAGPAGANLARLIADKYKVLIIDKRDLNNTNPENHLNKCCGGLLAPDAQKMLAKLGLGIPKSILVDPQLFAVRTIDLTNKLERLYQRFYFNLDREKFDRWLVSLIPSSVEKSFNSVFKSFTQVSDGYEVSYINNGKLITVSTKAIIGADGALSRIRPSICNNINTPTQYISIQEWFEYSSPMPYFTAIFDEEISDFYSWIIPKENCLLLGTALTPKDQPWEKYYKLKDKLKDYGFSFDNKIKTEGAFIFRPQKTSQLFFGKDNIALVGEAAGAISPSSAEGISYALKSSLYLAQSLENGIDGFINRYKTNAKDIKLNILMKNLKSPAMYNSGLRKVAMKTGLLSIK